MLTDEEIVARVAGLPGAVAIRVLAELANGNVFEADRLLRAQYGPDRSDEAMELVASIVRGTVRGAA